MKRLIALLLVLGLSLSLTACITINVTPSGGSSSQYEDNSQPADKNSQQGTVTPSQTSDPQPTYNPETMETDYALYSQWAKLVGWWNDSDGHFLSPDMADSHSAVISYGMWDTEYCVEGRVVYMYQNGDSIITAYVQADGTQEIFTIDYSQLETSAIITVSIGDRTTVYSYAGDIQNEAYQSYLDGNSSSGQSTPQGIDPQAGEKWKELKGYWNAQEGYYIIPDYNSDSGRLFIQQGIWDTDFYRLGNVTYMYQDGIDTIVAGVDFDGVQETVTIEYKNHKSNSTIQARIGDDRWRLYKFSGTWSQLAYDVYLSEFKN